MAVESLILLAQFDPTNRAARQAGAGVLAGCTGVCSLLWLALLVLVIAGFWKTFAKAGKPGWAAIVPIYNVIVLLEIADRPVWWVLLFLIPVVNLVVSIIVAIDVARNFGKDTAFGIALAFLPFIFYPILGFGAAQYRHVPHY